MKAFPSFLLGCATVLAIGATTVTYEDVQVFQDGTLRKPTNFFLANSNLIAAVSGGSATLPSGVITNGQTNVSFSIGASDGLTLLGPNGGPHPYQFLWRSGELRLTNAVNQMWYDFEDGLTMGTETHTVGVRLTASSGDVSFTGILNGNLASGTNLPASAITGAPWQAQTPWTSDIQAGGFVLRNCGGITGIGSDPIDGKMANAAHSDNADAANSAGYANAVRDSGGGTVILRSLDNGATVEIPNGILTCNGEGVTNLPGGAVISAVAEAAHATNANIAAASAVATNNPAGQAIAGLSGLQTFTGSICATGAQYIAVSNGAARVLLTNGNLTMSGTLSVASTTIGGSINASGAMSVGAAYWYGGGPGTGGTVGRLYPTSTNTWTFTGNQITNPATVISGCFRSANGFVSTAVGPFTILTNATPPADILVVKAWVTVTNQADGSVWKMPLYQ